MCSQSVCTYFNDRADTSRYEDKQAGLLVKQIEENHYGAETSPEHWKTQHTDIKCYTDSFALLTADKSFGPDLIL